MKKLDQSIRKMIKSHYPDGFDGQTFNLRLPTSKEVFKMIRFETDNIQYMVKVGPAIEGVDYTVDRKFTKSTLGKGVGSELGTRPFFTCPACCSPCSC